MTTTTGMTVKTTPTEATWKNGMSSITRILRGTTKSSRITGTGAITIQITINEDVWDADRHRGATLSVVRVEDKSEKGCKCVHKGTDFDRVSR